MVAKFIFMRHGEAEHNVAFKTDGEAAYQNPTYRDAKLTDRGVNQCNETAETLSRETIERFDAVYTSPLTRCIQTALLVRQWIDYENFNAADELIERRGGGHVCNARRTRTEIDAEFSAHGLNCSLLAETDEEWDIREPMTFVESRLIIFLRGLVGLYEASENANILVVTHHDVLYTLLVGTSLDNAETFVLDLDELKELIY
jgi:broad specificity phosphatase PhoE